MSSIRQGICRGLVLLFGLLVFLASSSTPAQEAPQASADDIGGASLSPAEIKECLKGLGSASCLDDLFREFLKNHTPGEALKLIQRFEAEDPELRRSCHPVVHAIGRENFRQKGNIHDSFAACDQTCHSGCYHGSVERFLRGDDVYSQTDKHPSQAELKQKAAAACDPNTAMRLRFQCLHGLGHALMFFSRYELDPSLSACDALPDDWSRNSCYGGVFMENVSNATHETKNFSPTDYHVPCNRVESRYRRECYMMQTSRMSEMGLPLQQMFEECLEAGEYRIPCAQSIGRDLSNEARAGQPGFVAEKCQIARGESRHACVRGVVYALADNTWDGRYAMPFCVAFSQEADRAHCFEESVDYLRTVFEKSSEEVVQDCKRYAAGSPRCLELATR
jgi:hypothetical protein